jgi:hypothetical protein
MRTLSELSKEAIICSPVTSVLVFESCKPSLASLNFSAAGKMSLRVGHSYIKSNFIEWARGGVWVGEGDGRLEGQIEGT